MQVAVYTFGLSSLQIIRL